VEIRHLLVPLGRKRAAEVGPGHERVGGADDQLGLKDERLVWTLLMRWPAVDQEDRGGPRPRVFYDPRALEPDGPGGVLHAKAVVVDDEVVFITSANLTEAALDANIELGVLARDRGLAASVSTHFQVLIDQGILKPLPAD
jgi:phosphatidylserine/phosphatidylglycerophosphate/cardiolipin synthase-like enzyme